jgi:hypothetical protein
MVCLFIFVGSLQALLFFDENKGENTFVYLVIKARFEEDIKIILLSENFVW